MGATLKKIIIKNLDNLKKLYKKYLINLKIYAMAKNDLKLQVMLSRMSFFTKSIEKHINIFILALYFKKQHAALLKDWS